MINLEFSLTDSDLEGLKNMIRNDILLANSIKLQALNLIQPAATCPPPQEKPVEPN